MIKLSKEYKKGDNAYEKIRVDIKQNKPQLDTFISKNEKEVKEMFENPNSKHSWSCFKIPN